MTSSARIPGPFVDGGGCFLTPHGLVCVRPWNPDFGTEGAIRLSAAHQERLRKLRSEIAEREAEMATVVGEALGIGGLVVAGTVSAREQPSGPVPFMRKAGFVFFNDGAGHCGVWDEGAGVCASVSC
ncbi:MAG: hypothetical protein IT379_11870 [Deltaproteobacteria bacterium]|nr:hypothetical protein [Deltaproteobacteria bacterium]